MGLSPAVILYDASGVAMAVSNGVAIPVGTTALVVAGSDGTNARFLRTATDGTVRTDPTGTTTQPVSSAQLPSALVAGRLDENVGSWLGSTAPTVGQKTMAASLPVAFASDQVMEISGGTIAESGSYPDPHVEEVGTDGFYSDAWGNLRIRGPVLTDEGSFRDDFTGSSLETALTGTLTFTNGSTAVTGSGTAFTSELQTTNYIKLVTDGETARALIDTIVDDTNLMLAKPYVGSSGSGVAVASFWETTTPPPPAAITVGSSTVQLVARTTSGDVVAIERDGDYLPCSMVARATISQRIANQELCLGFADSLTDPLATAIFLFDGTNDKVVKCQSSYAADSVQESVVSLPGGTTTGVPITYEIVLGADRVSFLVNGSLVAAHRIHLPGPYEPLKQVVCVENLAAVASATTFTLDTVFFSNRDQLNLDEPVAIEGYSSGQPVLIQFGTPGGGTALPKLINVNFNKTEGAVVAATFKRVATYTVPTSFTGYLIKFVSYQAEVAASRVIAETIMGTFVDSTNTWTVGTAYTTPQWAPIVQAEVTTAFASGSGNVVLSVNYTNESGVAGRTGTITIPKGSALLSRWDLVLQTGDLGVQSIQTVSGTPTQNGAVKILGLIHLAYHQDQSTTTQTETLYAPGAITFPSGTTLGLEYSGGTVAKLRYLDALIQLVQ